MTPKKTIKFFVRRQNSLNVVETRRRSFAVPKATEMFSINFFTRISLIVVDGYRDAVGHYEIILQKRIGRRRWKSVRRPRGPRTGYCIGYSVRFECDDCIR